MKKTLALVLAFCMVFSSISFAFADTTTTTTTAAISKDAQACVTLGMLQGSDKGVTAEYLAGESTRLQAAIMVLRLKGLEAEALAYVGEKNFSDMATNVWAGAKNITAFLLAHPELGYIGDAGKFMPEQNINEASYYKVMLTALGYKQTTPEVVGDYAWTEVLAFAKSIGLAPQSSVTFTNNDIARITVEALTAKTKDGKVLVDTLVAAGILTAEKVAAAGIVVSAPVTVAVKTVKAVGNTVVEVEYKAAVDKAAAENVANYSIAGLEVKSAVLDGTKKVLLGTAAQTAGAKYTLTVADAKFNFGGVAKSTAAAELDKVEGTDTERVELTFTKVLDLSVLDVANYTIAGVTVKSAAWADSSRKIVELTTEGLVANKTYKVTAANIKTIDLVNLKSASKNFLAKSDKVAPKATINKLKSTNTRIIVEFDEVVTAESAENLANYSLMVGSTSTELSITSAKLVADADDDMTIVELTTDSQKVGTKYVLHINNIVDDKVLANKMTKVQKLDYYGKRIDDSKPTISSVDYLTNKIIEVTFADASRLDKTALLDVSNYTVNNDVAIETVALTDEDDADCKTIRLTVSELGEKSSYKITIKNIADEYGNVMSDKEYTKTFKKSDVNTPATVLKVVATKTTEVKVYFTKKVNSTFAKDVANYSVNNEIGTPVKASINDDNDMVTLTTGTLTAGKEYKLTVNGVEDLAGNVISNVVVKFVGITEGNDVEAPEVDEIETVNKNVVRVTFTEAIDVTVPPTITVDIDGAGTGADLTGTYKVSTDEDDMVLEFLLSAAFTSEDDVILRSTTAADKAGNICSDTDLTFASNVENAENPELVAWEQATVKKFKLVYGEKIDVAANGKVIAAGANVPYALTVTVDKDDNTIVYLEANQKMDVDKVFKLDLATASPATTILANYHGVAVDEDSTDGTVLETSLEDTDAPYIVDVKAINKNKVEVTFSEELRSAGSYVITYTDDKDVKKTITPTAAQTSLDEDVVTLELGTALDAKYVYTLSIGTTRAQDIAYNKVDADSEFDFVGTNVVAVGNYITGVEMVNGQKINVRTFDYVADTVAVVVYEDATIDVELVGAAIAYNATAGETKKITVTLTNDFVFEDGATYYVKVGSMTYTFKGIVESDVNVQLVVDVAGNYYQISYGDLAVGDKVYVNGTLETTVVTEADGARILTSGLAAGTHTVLVKRGTVPVFYTEGLIFE